MTLLTTIADFELPEWLTVGTLGTVLTSVVLMIISLIKTAATNKLNKATSTSETSILTTIVDNLLALKTSIIEVIDATKQNLTKIETALTTFKDSLNNQKNMNMNLAKYVYECFNLSNLSPEKKAQLKLLCNQIFYTDNTALIEQLQENKRSLEQQLLNKEKELANVNKNLQETQSKLEEQQTTVKKSRRVS